MYTSPKGRGGPTRLPKKKLLFSQSAQYGQKFAIFRWTVIEAYRNVLKDLSAPLNENIHTTRLKNEILSIRVSREGDITLLQK